MFGTLGLPEIILLIFLAVLLFGAKRIPEVFKGVGEGIKNFKEALKNEEKNDKENEKKEEKKLNEWEEG